jgi:hypothetical protein
MTIAVNQLQVLVRPTPLNGLPNRYIVLDKIHPWTNMVNLAYFTLGELVGACPAVVQHAPPLLPLSEALSQWRTVAYQPIRPSSCD